MVVHPARAWLLNFDAEAELEDPAAQTPSRAIANRSRALAAQVSALLGPGDVVIDRDSPAPHIAGAPPFLGRAWCPTPGALRAIAAAGAVVPRAPSFEVLRRVNHRRFSAELGETLPGARFVATRAELDAALALPSPTGRFLLKRPFGFAGRGRRAIGPGAPDEAETRWIEASLSRGEGLQIEPLVDRVADFALHGHLGTTGNLAIGEATVQRCDPSGAWHGSARAAPGELAEGEMRALAAAIEEAAAALRSAGYFGPFGVDAFRWRDASGASRFNPRCEINARYSMGWAIGMGEIRPDLAQEP